MRSLSLLILVSACASAPKPAELETLEKLRTQANLAAAQKRHPELARESEELFGKATEEWQAKDLEESRRDALMASIKLKTAMALAEQDQARARIARADSELARSEAEYAQVAKELNTTNEQISLLRKLGEARASAATDKAKLSEEQGRAAAQNKVSAAELALRNADMVQASQHAKDPYNSAKDMIERAQTELKQNNYVAAQTSADLARAKAEEAAKLARPAYESSEQHKTDKARDEALARDASAIPGVTVRLERRGDTQRLILPLRGMFAKKSSSVMGGDSALDAVATLLKKYPTYSVQVIGHTDNKGKKGELLALSLARANSVYSALVSRGVDPKRCMVSGSGSDEPVSDNKTSTGREQNNRVEVVFMY
jgi:outer membrane protein OmpA-like peptidoglycan-associated protein